MNQHAALVSLSQAIVLLKECSTVQEAKRYYDLAEAARVYAQMCQLGIEAQNRAAEIKLRAQRRMGEILAETVRRGRPRKGNGGVTFLPDGISKMQSSRCQKIASVPEAAFERHMAQRKDKEEAVSTASLLRLARSIQEKERKSPVLKGQYPVEIRHGDFRVVLADLAPHSVNMILTDPPYGKAYLDLWGDLGAFASRVLRKDGALVAYSGQFYLPQVIELLSKHLQWWWLCGVIHAGPGNLIPLGQPVRKVINQFKPLLIFVRPDGSGISVTFRDLIRGKGRDKQLHNWQQPVEEAKTILATFCQKGDLVVDPFAGSGSFGEAARQSGMRFIGAEIL